MYCPKCRKIIDNNSNFCTACGYRIKENLVECKKRNTFQENQLKLQAIQLKMQEQQLKLQEQQLRIQEQQYNAQLKCPKCGSTSISGNKKGYGVVKGGLGAVAAIALAPVTGGGSLVAGAIGAGAGNIGSKKVFCTCMNCGYKFKAGKK